MKIMHNSSPAYQLHSPDNVVLDFQKLAILFDDLPCDKYLKDGYRFKSIFRAIINEGEIVETPHGPLYQSTYWNPTHGDLIRDYPIMAVELRNQLKPLIMTFVRTSGIEDHQEMLIQAQRIIALPDASGLPTVEGWHQDGVEDLAIYMVGKENCTGGISQLSYDKGQNIVFSHELKPAEMLSLQDSLIYHYTTPISRINKRSAAYRDIIIISSPASRSPDYIQSAGNQLDFLRSTT